MSELPNPLSMFDVKGHVALITGASGAFGMVAARILAGAGAKARCSEGLMHGRLWTKLECGARRYQTSFGAYGDEIHV